MQDIILLIRITILIQLLFIFEFNEKVGAELSVNHSAAAVLPIRKANIDGFWPSSTAFKCFNERSSAEEKSAVKTYEYFQLSVTLPAKAVYAVLLLKEPEYIGKIYVRGGTGMCRPHYCSDLNRIEFFASLPLASSYQLPTFDPGACDLNEVEMAFNQSIISNMTIVNCGRINHSEIIENNSLVTCNAWARSIFIHKVHDNLEGSDTRISIGDIQLILDYGMRNTQCHAFNSTCVSITWNSVRNSTTEIRCSNGQPSYWENNDGALCCNLMEASSYTITAMAKLIEGNNKIEISEDAGEKKLKCSTRVAEPDIEAHPINSTTVELSWKEVKQVNLSIICHFNANNSNKITIELDSTIVKKYYCMNQSGENYSIGIFAKKLGAPNSLTKILTGPISSIINPQTEVNNKINNYKNSTQTDFMIFGKYRLTLTMIYICGALGAGLILILIAIIVALCGKMCGTRGNGWDSGD